MIASYKSTLPACRISLAIFRRRFFTHFKIFGVAAIVMLALVPRWSSAAEPLTLFQVVLLQSDAVFKERVPGVDALATYIKTVEAAVKSSLDSAGQQPPATGFFVIALRPGHRSNVWLDFDGRLSPALAAELTARIRAIMPITIKKGPVAFALKVGLWGGKETPRALPEPKEWVVVERLSATRQVDVDELLDLIWRD